MNGGGVGSLASPLAAPVAMALVSCLMMRRRSSIMRNLLVAAGPRGVRVFRVYSGPLSLLLRDVLVNVSINMKA